MRVLYRPDGDTLTRAQLRAWVALTLADFEGAAGVMIEITDPQYPYAFERSAVADDRRTQGGVHYARIRYQGRSGSWVFGLVPEVEMPDWRAWYDATMGLRLPFVAEAPGLGPVACLAPGPFPLQQQSPLRWGGQMAVEEWLG